MLIVQKNPELIDDALEFALEHHRGQYRKMSKLPYFYHCLEVSKIVSTFTDSSEVVAAAIMHDLIEDTSVTFEQIEQKFGSYVAFLVKELTNTDQKGLTRKEKLEINIERLSRSCPEAQLIKAADIMHNLSDIDKNPDKDYALMYIDEKKRTLAALGKLDKEVYDLAYTVIDFVSHLCSQK